ncbi:MAG: (2Fe-2S)-binding protein [Lautropia sp. SCN 69-89]|nr:MAG: (2Fe-2S)-binding protein [Lautropia sp. SCN 69-89]
MLRIPAGEKRRVEMTVNGRRISGLAEPRTLLSDFLRHELGMRGVHVGCEHGVCGACTVLVGGRAVRSCTQRAIEAEGADVVTVEGLAEGGRLSALQEAFRRHHALQCGFCTAGVLMSSTSYLEANPAPTEEQVREMLSGHICRCTGYAGMVEAILDVAATAQRDAEVQER